MGSIGINRFFSDVSKRIIAVACAVALVAGGTYVPSRQAYALESDDSASVQTALEGEGSSSGDLPDDMDYSSDEIIIVYDNAGGDSDGGLSAASVNGTYSLQGYSVEAALEVEGITVQETLAEADEDSGDVVLASVPESQSVEDAIEAAEATPGVAYAQPNYYYKLLEVTGADSDAVDSYDELLADALAQVMDDDADADVDASDDVEVDDSSYDAMVTVNDPVTSEYDGVKTNPNQYYLYGTTDKGTKGANVFDAWDYAMSDGDVTIAVLDTGVNLLHEDLKDNLITEYAYDAYNDTTLVASGSFNGDYYGHGTHVAGIAAATANNETGIAGASYNAKILPIKVFNDDSSDPTCSTSDIVEAYGYIFDLIDEGKVEGLHIINMSLGSYGTDSSDSAFHQKIKTAKDEYNILTVCAGGNGDSNNEPYTKNMYPSDYEECLSVTALQQDGTNCNWSDYNDAKDISAPGLYLYSTYNEGTDSYIMMSGTSMASPLVAGCAALLWAADPEITVDEAIAAIEDTADPIVDESDKYDRWPSKTGSAGAINAASAVQEVRGAKISLPEGQTSLYRTQTMQLSASINKVEDALEWTWSITDGDELARISAYGVLTAINAGRVTVCATTTYGGEQFSATRTIQINEIRLGSTPSATNSLYDGVKVSWDSATAAVAYKLMRQAVTGEDGPTQVAIVEGLEYVDSTVEPNKRYLYWVVPLGSLDGEYVEGEASASVQGLCFERVSDVDSQSDAVEDLLVHKYVDGSAVDTCIVVDSQDMQAASMAYGLAGALGAVIVTADNGTIDEDAYYAIAAVNPVRVVVVACGSSTKLEQAVKEAAPSSSVSVCGSAAGDAQKLAESVYTLGNGKWGSTAFVVSGSGASATEQTAMGSLAYAGKSAVFATGSNGSLDTTTRQYLRAGYFSQVVVLGDTDAVGENVVKQVKNLGISCVRVATDSVYEASSDLALLGAANGVFALEEVADAAESTDVTAATASDEATGGMSALEVSGVDTSNIGVPAFAGIGFSSSNLATCIQSATLLGYLKMPLIVCDAADESAVESCVRTDCGDTATMVFFGGDNGIASAEKTRVIDYSMGKDVMLTIPDGTRISLAKASVSEIADVVYNGSAYKPTPEVSCGGEILVNDTDYVIEYADNVNAGVATVRIVGQGSYTGYIEKTFTISKATLVATYAGETIRFGGSPALSVTVEGFVNGETAETALGYAAPLVAMPESVEARCSYSLAPAGGSAANYVFDYVAGTLIVKPMYYFSDVDYAGTTDLSWATDSILDAVDAGYMAAYTDQSGAATAVFGSTDGYTRADAVLAVYTMSTGAPSTAVADNLTDFVDLPSADKYTAAINWAVAHDAILWSGGEFDEDAAISVEEFAYLLWRAAGSPDVASVSAYAAYADAGSESTSAAEAVKWAASKDLLTVPAAVQAPGASKINAGAGVLRAQAARQLVEAASLVVATTADLPTIEFLGGSLRMSDTITAGTDDAKVTSAALRLGYKIVLPEGFDVDDLSWEWLYGAAGASGSVAASDLKYVRKGENYILKDGGVVSNLVFTDISASHFDTKLGASLRVSVGSSGHSLTVSDDVQTRSVNEVANLILKSKDATPDEVAYAKQILGVE